jgi:N6-L-threonylcarbamoyladenine synthase
VGGGVTANSRLRHDLAEFARTHQLSLTLPALGYCVDNGAMIAGLAFVLLASGARSDLTIQPTPTTAC